MQTDRVHVKQIDQCPAKLLNSWVGDTHNNWGTAEMGGQAPWIQVHHSDQSWGLGYLKMQHKLSSRQVWWVDYMSRFDVTIVYVKGAQN